MTIGRVLGEEGDLARYGQALALEKVGDGAAKRGIGNVVGAIGFHRQITAGKLMCTLGAGLDASELLGDGKLDSLVVADLEVEVGVVLDTSPIAAVERV